MHKWLQLLQQPLQITASHGHVNRWHGDAAVYFLSDPTPHTDYLFHTSIIKRYYTFVHQSKCPIQMHISTIWITLYLSSSVQPNGINLLHKYKSDRPINHRSSSFLQLAYHQYILSVFWMTSFSRDYDQTSLRHIKNPSKQKVMPAIAQVTIINCEKKEDKNF